MNLLRTADGVLVLSHPFRRVSRGTAVDEEVGMARSKKRHDDISSPSSERPPDSDRNGNGDFTDRVAARAYELYLARGARDGRRRATDQSGR